MGKKKKKNLQGEKRLPWHDHEWLKTELVRLGTVNAVAQRHGINLSTLQSYMYRHRIKAPHPASHFGRPLKDPGNPSKATRWRRRKDLELRLKKVRGY